MTFPKLHIISFSIVAFFVLSQVTSIPHANLANRQIAAIDDISPSRFFKRNSIADTPLLTSRSTCPGRYSFSLTNIDAVHRRSEGKDTVWISIAVVVGNNTYKTTEGYGKHGNGNFTADIVLKNIPVGDTDVAIFSYVIVNNGHQSQSQITQILEQATIAIATTGAQIAADVAIDEIIPAIARVIGIAFGNIVGWLIGFIGSGIEELVKEGCDGFLAAGYHGFSGQQICSGSVPLQGMDVSQGTSDEKLFGIIPGIVCSTIPSQYDVFWSVH